MVEVGISSVIVGVNVGVSVRMICVEVAATTGGANVGGKLLVSEGIGVAVCTSCGIAVGSVVVNGKLQLIMAAIMTANPAIFLVRKFMNSSSP
jgi:hypothetical protein